MQLLKDQFGEIRFLHFVKINVRKSIGNWSQTCDFQIESQMLSQTLSPLRQLETYRKSKTLLNHFL